LLNKVCTTMIDMKEKNRLKNCITLDNGLTLSLFSNPNIVQDIQTSSKTLSLATNAGVKQSNREAIVPGFEKIYYDEDAIANIFGFPDLKKKHRITKSPMIQTKKTHSSSTWTTKSSSLNAALRAIPIFGIRGIPTRPERRPKGKTRQ
jgi:hypothetical protein